MKRKSFEAKAEEKKLAEKRDKWLAELEARDQEDREWRERIEKASVAAMDVGEGVKEKAARMIEAGKQKIEEQIPPPGDVQAQTEEKKQRGWFGNKSVLEEVNEDGWGPGVWARRTRDACRRF